MKRFAMLALLATSLACVVVVLGAFVRLSDAGLGCPDWPGCYGRLLVPTEAAAVDHANASYPQRPIEHPKAWKEMIHRYLAATLGLVILALAYTALRRRHEPQQPVVLPMLLVVLVIFQGLLGMWTVTLLLKPMFVLLHLLGGMTTLLLLWWLTLRTHSNAEKHSRSVSVSAWAITALTVVYVQIALGGWTSSNYAALACADFPQCHGSFWPEMDFREGFVLWRGLGTNYEFGVLGSPARTAIHYTHRIGALVTAVVVMVLAVRCLHSGVKGLIRAGAALIALLAAQLGLGVANVLYGLPLPVAVAHNAGAALLLLAVATVLYFASWSPGAQASILPTS